MSGNNLYLYKNNIYSQFGEDGIIEELLLRISKVSELDKWCVEFGAWDGIHYSNTYNLINNNNYRAVLIEGDRKKYKQLCDNIPYSTILKICQLVNFEGDSTLDNILQKTKIPKQFDFLSIDIDGCDYFIFDSLSVFKPKIVCIEYNPTIPNEVEFIQPRDLSIKQGSSARSLVMLSDKKDYTLVTATQCNLFFVYKKYEKIVIGGDEITLDDVRDDIEIKNYIFCGFDGSVFTSKSLFLVWHSLEIPSSALQQIPMFLRKYSGDYNLFQKILYRLFVLLKSPRNAIWRIKSKLFKSNGAPPRH